MAVRTNSNFVLCITDRLVFITEVESVYCAVRTECVYNTDMFRLSKADGTDHRPSFPCKETEDMTLRCGPSS
jgi:hypothetical protein